MKKFYNSIKVFVFIALFFASFASNAQYCTAVHSNNCAATGIITKVHIAGTTLYNTVSACASNSPVFTFAASGFTTCTLYRDSGYNTYTISVTTNNVTKQKVGMWIDFNHDYVFDTALEWFLINISNTANVPSTITFTVPTNAAIGQTEMRIRTRNFNAGIDSTSYCKTLGSGSTNRYTITIDSLAACSGSPSAGSVAITTDSVCSKVNIFFAKSGGTWALSQTIQWQFSVDSVNWNDLTSDTNISMLKAAAITGYYRYYTSCGGNTDTTAAQFIYVYPLTNCYCTPVHINFCNTNHLITNVSITGTGLNNTVSTCQSASTVYWKFGPSSGTSDSVYLGNTYQFNVTTNFNDIIGMWIDFNHNAVFDTYEWFLIKKSSTANVSSSIYVTIPYTADSGYTPIRIRAITAGTVLDSSGACKGFASGNSHDYQIYLKPLPPCTSPPTAGTSITSDTLVCASTTFTLSLQGNTYGAGQTYQWQASSTGNTGTWADLNNDTTTGVKRTQTSSSYYRCFVNCGGKTDTSTSVYVGLNPFYDCYCFQSLQTNACDSNRMLTNFKITNTSLDNTVSSCSVSATAPHFVFSQTGNLTADLIRGKTYRFNGTTNINGSISVWLDYNKSGTFDSAEWTSITTTSGVNTNNFVNITIPANTPLGMTGLRVRSRTGAAANTAKLACTTFANGSTHDYIVNITDPYTTDMGPNRLLNPANALCYSSNEPVTVQVTNYGSDTLDFSKKNLTITVDYTGITSMQFDTTITSGILTPSATMDVYFVDTVDMSTPATAYDFVISTIISNDSNIYNDTFRITRTSAQTLGLNYLENFNISGIIPASYIGNGFAYTATNGVGGGGSLRANFTTTTNSFGIARSPVVGPLTSKSALLFSYKASTAMKAKDTIFVQLSTDCGTNYNTIYSLNSSNTTTNTYQSVQYNLAAFAGNNAVIRFIKTDSSTTLYYVYIDNVILGDVPDIALGNDTSLCDKLLLDANPYLNSWDVNWSTGAGPQDTLTVYASGSYIAIATDQNYGLVNSDTIKITLYSTPKVKLGNAQTMCSGTGILLDAGTWPAGYTYLWNTGDTMQTITVYTSNTYKVSVNNPGGCPGSDSVKITVNPKPQGVNFNKAQNFTGQYNQGTSSNPDAACVGSNMSYDITTSFSNAQYGNTWTITTSTIKTVYGNSPVGTTSITFPGAINGNINFIPAAFDADSVFVLTLTVNDKSTGCDTIIYRYMSVKINPTVSLGNDQTVCPGTQVSFTSSSSFAQYLWSDGSTSIGITPTLAGTYWLKVTDNNGCTNTDSAVLNNFTPPIVNLGADKDICPNSSITLNGGNAPTYNWSNGANTQTINVNSNGIYWLEMTDANGCKGRDTVNVNVLPKPKATFTYAKNTATNIQFTPDDVTQSAYNWTFGDGNNSNNVAPSHNYNTAGSYIISLVVTGTNGCVDSSTQTVALTSIAQANSIINELYVFPNPYSQETNLNFILTKTSFAEIELYDLYGRKISIIARGNLSTGKHIIPVNTTQQKASQGIYLLRLTIEGQTSVLRIMDLSSK
ncbi:MAG: GEVED domain-containing protein [Bacteroidota bacterium]|nr:GEVED domain-containing protein [Bacteroidota bacterium]